MVMMMGSDNEPKDLTINRSGTKRVMHRHVDRVSDDAAVAAAVVAERTIEDLTRAAYIIAQNDGRSTVMEKDIRAAQRVYSVLNDD